MALTTKQHGVVKRIISGVCITAVVLAGAAFIPRLFSMPMPGSIVGITERLAFTLKLETVLATWLALSIGLLARHRFFNVADLDGSGLTPGSDKARILQANLQNTLEQTLLAVLVHLIWASYMPADFLMVIPAAVALFIIGRILFLAGYHRGAEARALGFALTFYPSVLMLAVLLLTCLSSLRHFL